MEELNLKLPIRLSNCQGRKNHHHFPQSHGNELHQTKSIVNLINDRKSDKHTNKIQELKNYVNISLTFI